VITVVVPKHLRGCFNKCRYADEKRAKLYARKWQMLKGVKLFYYACKICESYHLTKRDQRKKK
jgi:hypothetical protein